MLYQQDVRLGQAHISELAQLVAHLVNILLNFRSDDSFRTIVQILKVCASFLIQQLNSCMHLCELVCAVFLWQ